MAIEASGDIIFTGSVKININGGNNIAGSFVRNSGTISITNLQIIMQITDT